MNKYYYELYFFCDNIMCVFFYITISINVLMFCNVLLLIKCFSLNIYMSIKCLTFFKY